MSTPTEDDCSGRADAGEVRRQQQTFLGGPCAGVFDSLPGLTLVLNSTRQVIYANRAALEFMGQNSDLGLLGERPGEALGCVNAWDSPLGCGESPHCGGCGARLALLDALDGKTGEGQCRLLRRTEHSLEVLEVSVCAVPLEVGPERFTVFTLTDITGEMRRRNMERVFFHDVLNLAGGIGGLMEVLRDRIPEQIAVEFSVLRTATGALLEEITAQRDLVAAENSELRIRPSAEKAAELLEQVRQFYARQPLTQGQEIRVGGACPGVELVTDARLLRRVLGNMVKNALEAGGAGDTVWLDCAEQGDMLAFSVQNAGVIPLEVQSNIFRRAFSTKGNARGLGTYSMLLLAERYLGGSVSFTSSEAQGGTTFTLRVPRALPRNPDAEAPATRNGDS